jgi:hypothetical protein
LKCIFRSRRHAKPQVDALWLTTRLAINELRSARVRRERYVGEWLPEPIITDGDDDPALHAEIADSLLESRILPRVAIPAKMRRRDPQSLAR